MYDFTCLNCGKKAVLPVTSCTPKKFCCRTCYREYIAKHRTMPDTKPRINSRMQAAPAKAGASDTSRKPLVDIGKCKRCAYGTGDEYSNACSCNYFVIAGHSRTSLHPEGLTSTCYEFKPKKKPGRPKQGIVIKR
jgi:hypothetical protein